MIHASQTGKEGRNGPPLPSIFLALMRARSNSEIAGEKEFSPLLLSSSLFPG